MQVCIFRMSRSKLYVKVIRSRSRSREHKACLCVLFGPLTRMFANYSASVGERSIAISLSVCVSVRLSFCLSANISLELLYRSSQFLCRSPVAVQVLLWRRCDMLCTSGFMDDVTFGRNGAYGDAWKAEPLNLLPVAAL